MSLYRNFSALVHCVLSLTSSDYFLSFLQARFAKDEGNFAEARTLGRNARDIAVASLILGIFLILVAVLIVVLLWQTVGFK